MKKYLLCLAFIFVLCQATYAQDMTQLVKDISATENVEKLKIRRFMMTLGKMFSGINNIPGVKEIHSMEIFSLEDCDQNIREKFMDRFQNVEDGNGYETLIRVKDEEESVRIMIKKEKNIIKEIVLLCVDDSDPTLLKFSGKIKESDIEKLINKYSNEKNN